MDFFYRIDYLSLTPGNKSSGFVFEVSTEALAKLIRKPVTLETQERIRAEVRKRLVAGGLASTEGADDAGIVFWKDTACPRYFMESQLGGSIGAEPNTFPRLLADDAVDYLGSSIGYTPHNIDAPSQALSLIVACATWGEWVNDLMLLK